MKTLKDMFWGKMINQCLCGGCDQGCGCDIQEIRYQAIEILKINKEINTADWVEFFNIEKEFADECLTSKYAVHAVRETGGKL